MIGEYPAEELRLRLIGLFCEVESFLDAKDRRPLCGDDCSDLLACNEGVRKFLDESNQGADYVYATRKES